MSFSRLQILKREYINCTHHFSWWIVSNHLRIDLCLKFWTDMKSKSWKSFWWSLEHERWTFSWFLQITPISGKKAPSQNISGLENVFALVRSSHLYYEAFFMRKAKKVCVIFAINNWSMTIEILSKLAKIVGKYFRLFWCHLQPVQPWLQDAAPILRRNNWIFNNWQSRENF